MAKKGAGRPAKYKQPTQFTATVEKAILAIIDRMRSESEQTLTRGDIVTKLVTQNELRRRATNEA